MPERAPPMPKSMSWQEIRNSVWKVTQEFLMQNDLNHHAFIKCLLSVFNIEVSVSIWFHGECLKSASPEVSSAWGG